MIFWAESLKDNTTISKQYENKQLFSVTGVSLQLHDFLEISIVVITDKNQPVPHDSRHTDPEKEEKREMEDEREVRSESVHDIQHQGGVQLSVSE